MSTLQRLAASRVYTMRRGPAKGLKRRGGLGFMPQLGRRPSEETFLGRLDFSEEIVYDIGGYVGIFTLFFARQVGPAGRVLTFEPNPRNCERILENVRLNGFTDVEVQSIALGAKTGRATFVFPTDQPARGSLADDIHEELLHEKRAATIEVEVDSLDHQISHGLPEPDFVKIDVEGFEQRVLKGMAQVIARRRPPLYIEVHGANRQRKLANATSIVEHLWSAGYLTDHVESGTRIDNRSRIPIACRGHLYCR